MDQIEKTEAEHSHQINVLDHKVDELSDHVDNITANMEDQWLKYNRRVGIIAINSQYMMALDKSDFVLDTIINALIDLHNGKISTSLVPIEVAEEAVANSTAIGQYSALRGLSLEGSFLWDITVVIVGVGAVAVGVVVVVVFLLLVVVVLGVVCVV